MSVCLTEAFSDGFFFLSLPLSPPPPLIPPPLYTHIHVRSNCINATDSNDSDNRYVCFRHWQSEIGKFGIKEFSMEHFLRDI